MEKIFIHTEQAMELIRKAIALVPSAYDHLLAGNVELQEALQQLEQYDHRDPDGKDRMIYITPVLDILVQRGFIHLYHEVLREELMKRPPQGVAIPVAGPLALTVPPLKIAPEANSRFMELLEIAGIPVKEMSDKSIIVDYGGDRQIRVAVIEFIL